MIVCFRERPEGQAAVAFEAATVRNSLRAKYGIKDEPAARPAAARDRTKPIDPYARD